MIIIDNNKLQTTTFDCLCDGQVFRYQKTGILMMRTDSDVDNSIILEDGELLNIEHDEIVELIHCKLLIER